MLLANKPKVPPRSAAPSLKGLFWCLFSGCLIASAQNETPASCRLTVTVSNVRSTQGQLRLSLYRGPNGFPGDPKRAALLKNISAAIGAQTLSLTGLVPGDYAVAVTHDENGNGKLDTRLFGIPKEGVGVSNNPKPRMGPPSYQSARFALHGPEQAIEVKLVY